MEDPKRPNIGRHWQSRTQLSSDWPPNSVLPALPTDNEAAGFCVWQNFCVRVKSRDQCYTNPVELFVRVRGSLSFCSHFFLTLRMFGSTENLSLVCLNCAHFEKSQLGLHFSSPFSASVIAMDVELSQTILCVRWFGSVLLAYLFLSRAGGSVCLFCREKPRCSAPKKRRTLEVLIPSVHLVFVFSSSGLSSLGIL